MRKTIKFNKTTIIKQMHEIWNDGYDNYQKDDQQLFQN